MPVSIVRIRLCLPLLLLLATPWAAHAATRVWPGSPECATTLQACADGALDGDRIEIATLGPIDEDLTLVNRSLSLTAFGALRPAFAPGRRIDVGSNASGTNIAFTVSRLKLVDAYVRLHHGGSGTATFDVRGLDLERTPGGAPAYIRISAASDATVNATVSENRVHGTPAGLNAGLIELSSAGGTLNVLAAYNRLSRNAPGTGDGGGIVVDVAGFIGTGGAGNVRLFGNELRGGFGRGAIMFSEGLFSSTPSAFSAVAINNAIICGGSEFARAIAFNAGSGTIDALAVNNTISDCFNGISAARWSGATNTSRVNGHVRNNLVAVANNGLQFTAALTPDLLNDYNLINAAGNSATLGSHTITAAARLVAASAPRLRAGSPAINAADSAFLANALVDAGLPTTDADGLRRVKGAGADIGAYESGDHSTLHIASGANTDGHITRIDSPHGNAQPGALLLATRIYGPAGPRSLEPFGVYYDGGSARWTVYHETFAAVGSGLRWGVFGAGSGAGAFIHAGSAANTTGSHTQVDNGATNGQPGRIVLVAHNWSATPTYNAQLAGIYYSGSGAAGRWNIANLDGATLPATSGFNVYAQPASPNAFRVTATVGTRRVELDHPLVNGVACATIHATRVAAAANAGAIGSFDLDYNAITGRWGIYSPIEWSPGTAFNVLIDPAQVFECTDRIFASGFD